MLLFVSDMAAWYKSSCSFTSIRRYSRTCAAQLHRRSASCCRRRNNDSRRHTLFCLTRGSSSVDRCGASFMPIRISSSSRNRPASFLVLKPFHSFWKKTAAWSASISARAPVEAL